ncbi:MAG: c-type cytochrome [Gemmatimonadota bacterium]
MESVREAETGPGSTPKGGSGSEPVEAAVGRVAPGAGLTDTVLAVCFEAWILATLVGAVALLGPTTAFAQDGSADPSGQELFVEVLGCSGCHGRSGEGGMGPALAESRLTLAKFIKQTRLPEEDMPPFSPVLANDEELAVIYDWLTGVDRVATPPPVVFELEGFDEVTAASPDVVAFAAGVSDEAGAAPLPTEADLAYRITLLERDVSPLTGESLGMRAEGEEAWREVETDGDGMAIFEPRGDRSGVEAIGQPGGSAFELRLTLPEGRYSFVVEALDRGRDDSDPLVLGVGSAVLEVE